SDMRNRQAILRAADASTAGALRDASRARFERLDGVWILFSGFPLLGTLLARTCGMAISSHNGCEPILVSRCPGHHDALDEGNAVIEHDAHDRQQDERAECQGGA